MERLIKREKSEIIKKAIVIDLMCFGAVYGLTYISHLYGIYVFEPIRVLIFFVLIFSGRKNSMFMAVTLPIFSSALTGHPFVWKSAVMSVEMISNVALYFWLKQLFRRKLDEHISETYLINKIENQVSIINETLLAVTNNVFVISFISIIVSKILYYFLKFSLIKFSLISGDSISTSLIIQLVVAIVLSAGIFSAEKIKCRNR